MKNVDKYIRTLERNILLINALQRSNLMSTDPFDDINDEILVQLLVENEDLKDELAKNKEYANLSETTLDFNSIKAIENELKVANEKRKNFHLDRKPLRVTL